jgi:hypothetical protein
MWRMSVASAVCIAVGLVAAARLLAPGEAIGGDKAPSAKSILDKATAFHGGAKALGRELALVRTEESEMILDGDKVTLKCEWQFQPPDKRALQAIVKIGTLQLNIHQAVVGDKGWIKFGPAAAADLPAEQVAGFSWEHDNHVKNVQMLASVERTHDIGAPQPIRIGDRDAWQIDFADKKDKKRSFTAFFDKTTGRVLGDETVRVVAALAANNAREKPVKFRVLFHSFLDVDGIKMPDALAISRDGATVVEVRKSQVRVVNAIDPKLFIKPN